MLEAQVELVTDVGTIVATQVIDGIAVDPVSPPGYGDHLRRTEAEITLWRCRRYVVSVPGGWQVRVLDGLTSDRPTEWQAVGTLAEAIQQARS